MVNHVEGRRQAPKRAIQEINRRGSWGGVKYDHLLECGHTEILARASRAKKVACSSCARIGEGGNEAKLRELGIAVFPVGTDDGDQSAASEIEVSKTRAALASAIKVPVDAIEIVSSEHLGMLEIRAAYVFLSAGDIRRILTKGEASE